MCMKHALEEQQVEMQPAASDVKQIWSIHARFAKLHATVCVRLQCSHGKLLSCCLKSGCLSIRSDSGEPRTAPAKMRSRS